MNPNFALAVSLQMRKIMASDPCVASLHCFSLAAVRAARQTDGMKGTTMRWPLAIATVAVACALAVLGTMIALAETGAGHGTYLTAKLLFPYTMLSTHLFDEITPAFIALALAQFPLYGLLLALEEWKKRFWLMAAGIALIHLLAVSLCFVFPMPAFPSFRSPISLHRSALPCMAWLLNGT